MLLLLLLLTKCLENSGKRSNFVLEKSGKPQSDFCTNPEMDLFAYLLKT